MIRRIISAVCIITFIVVVFVFYCFGPKIRISMLPKVKNVLPDYVVINGEYCYSLPANCIHNDSDMTYIIVADPIEKYEYKIYITRRTEIKYENNGDTIIVKNGVDASSVVIINSIGVGELCALDGNE